FDADSAVSVAIMQLQSDPEPPRKINPDIPVGLEEIVIKTMQKDPKKRYRSASEMYADLIRFKKNPSIVFNFNYDDIPEEPVKPQVNTVKKIETKSEYKDDDDWDDDDDDRGTSPVVQAIIGSGIAFAAVLLVFLVLAVFKGFSNNSTTDVLVPNLIGLHFTDVNKDKVTYNFKWDVTNIYDADKPLDIIISQSPEPSEKRIKEGSTIQVTVNSEETTINLPNVDGRTKDDAVQKMKSAHLVPEVLMVLDNQTAEGYVKQTYPLSGAKVTIDSSVKIYVSKKAGEAKIEVPNLVGLTLSEAQSKLVEVGLNYNGYSYMESTVAKDKIVAQNPLRGAKVNKGTNVTVILSEGPPRNVSLSHTVDLPADVASSVKFEVIIDGEVDNSYTKSIVPKYAKQYTLSVSRMSTVGSLQVVVALNEHTYRVYNFDFANNTVTPLESYDFVLDDTDTETDTETETDDGDTSNTESDTESLSSDDTSSENYYEDTDTSDYEDDTESYVSSDEPVISYEPVESVVPSEPLEEPYDDESEDYSYGE
ncbi:MAG: PASTA domain-containing protein, partial [Clostridia bacterium]|nr:PASTA domain-containing protein [Clostridia bacterium]